MSQTMEPSNTSESKPTPKTNSKQASSELIPGKAHPAMKSSPGPAVLKESSAAIEVNESRGSPWSCLCCILGCFLCCYTFCPPVPSIVTRKMAFNPPPRGQTYGLAYTMDDGSLVRVSSARKAFGRNVKILPKGKDVGEKQLALLSSDSFVVKSGSGNYLVGINFHPIKKAQDVILICAQPNACDLGDFVILHYLSEWMQVDLCAFDYSGYGLSTGSPSEANMYKDIESVFDYVCATNVTAKIVLLGMSIGTAACVDLASTNPDRLAGVILVSPFTSGCRLLRADPWLKVSSSFDTFCSVDKIGNIDVPVLLIHGEKDVAIPIDHSSALYRKLKNPVQPLFVSEANHNDIVGSFPQVYRRMERFIEREI